MCSGTYDTCVLERCEQECVCVLCWDRGDMFCKFSLMCILLCVRYVIFVCVFLQVNVAPGIDDLSLCMY
jgi:hypothetical protein